MFQRKLPADPSALVLAIVALCMAILFGCCGLSFVGLALSIIGLVSANKSLKEYQVNPETYSHNSRENVNTARIINIIALVINGLITLAFVVYLVITGSFMFSAIREEMNKSKTDSLSRIDDEEWDYEAEEDSIYIYTDSLNQLQDSLSQE